MIRSLYVSSVWPEPDSSAAGRRSHQVIRALVSAGHQVAVASSSRTNNYREQLNALNVETHEIEVNDPRFDDLVSSIRPNVVVFDRFLMEEQFGWRVRSNAPDALRVIDAQDLHFLRKSRQKDESNPSFDTEDCYRELASILRSDLTLLLSDFERATLGKLSVPEHKTIENRLGYKGEEIRDGLLWRERRDLVFIGNYRHLPNLEAAHWLKKNWKEIRAQFKDSVELHLYGAYAPREVSEMEDSATGFRFCGKAPDAIETLGRYRLNLAPLRFGAGVKGKVTDGWAAGTPCVASAIGLEGLTDERDFGGVKIELADLSTWTSAASIYFNETEWAEQSNLSQVSVREGFSEAIWNSRLNEELSRRLDSIQEDRERDWIQKVLWSQGLRATEFFSRWIEEKSKR